MHRALLFKAETHQHENGKFHGKIVLVGAGAIFTTSPKHLFDTEVRALDAVTEQFGRRLEELMGEIIKDG